MRKYYQTIYLYLAVFIAGAATLMIEILGTRVLAPFYGATVYVWSSLLSVAMAFLALGYIWGGKLADKKPKWSLVSWSLFLAAIFVLLIMKIDAFILIKTQFLGFKFGPLTAAVILFSLPLFFLGTISPLAVKLQVKELSILGTSAGNLYAIATIGSLAGALVSGFYLISHFSLTFIFDALAVLLLIFFLGGQFLSFIKDSHD